MILPLDSATGMPREGAQAKSIVGRPGNGAIEAPKIVRRPDFIYLFVSFDYCCRLLVSTYNIRVGRSETVDGEYIDRDGKPMTPGGGTLVLEGDGERICGPLQIRPLTWDDEGWP